MTVDPLVEHLMNVFELTEEERAFVLTPDPAKVARDEMQVRIRDCYDTMLRRLVEEAKPCTNS